MSVEHRWSVRKQIYLDALIFCHTLGLLQVKILDIGLDGAFISREHLKLPWPAMVELTFALDDTGKQCIYQGDAMVIHQGRNGCGLMFRNFRLEAFRALRGMLYAA